MQSSDMGNRLILMSTFLLGGGGGVGVGAERGGRQGWSGGQERNRVGREIGRAHV